MLNRHLFIWSEFGRARGDATRKSHKAIRENQTYPETEYIHYSLPQLRPAGQNESTHRRSRQNHVRRNAEDANEMAGDIRNFLTLTAANA